MEHRPWHDCYDEGIPSSLTYPEVPLFHFLEDSAKKYPDKPCTIFKGAEISYQEMSKITDQLAAALVGLGVKKGDRVGILIPNTPQFVMAYFAVLKTGGVVVATNPQYTEREIKHQANDSGMKLMILMSNYYELVKRVQPETSISQIIVTNIKETLPPLTGLLFTLLKEKKGGFKVTLRDNDLWMPDLQAQYSDHERPQVDVGPDDIAIFQYSGGTTGIPKAAIGLHRNLVANTVQMLYWVTSAEMGKEVVMMAIPLYHVYGMVAGMNFGLGAGATLVMVPDPRNLKDLLGNMQKYQTSIFPAVPALYNAINNNADVIAGKYDLSAIKACISGSAPLLRETKETFEKLTGGFLFEGYGLSETPTATHCNPNLGVNKIGSIGLPFPDVDAKIVDLDDEVTELAVGEIGELIIKAPQVFKGYYNMPTETRNSLREGWLYTGDIARMDEQGYFYIVDRKKELIKPGGFQVWPREVEEVLQDHPAIQDVGVAGVPDPKRGEIVKAWIVLTEGQSLDREELKTWAKERMARYKIPSEIEFRDELPKTHVGKLLRRELVREHKEEPGG
ncbi:MAG: long-chain fatty acid--CoA ligase [Anaerolineales bacterium]|nr:long-chain fatty acid--CoA ligase [Anaerolineales bacterium]